MRRKTWPAFFHSHTADCYTTLHYSTLHYITLHCFCLPTQGYPCHPLPSLHPPPPTIPAMPPTFPPSSFLMAQYLQYPKESCISLNLDQSQPNAHALQHKTLHNPTYHTSTFLAAHPPKGFWDSAGPSRSLPFPHPSPMITLPFRKLHRPSPSSNHSCYHGRDWEALLFYLPG